MLRHGLDVGGGFGTAAASGGYHPAIRSPAIVGETYTVAGCERWNALAIKSLFLDCQVDMTICTVLYDFDITSTA